MSRSFDRHGLLETSPGMQPANQNHLSLQGLDVRTLSLPEAPRLSQGIPAPLRNRATHSANFLYSRKRQGTPALP